MKNYLSVIFLAKNSRGIYCLDTTMGCASGMAEAEGGCYGDCYAAKTAKQYGHDFSKTVLRDFEGWAHLNETVRQINSCPMDFIRIGCSGDPSENWEHTFNILWQIGRCNKEIVIITRHWTILSDEQLKALSFMNVCINTSVSALDKPEIRHRSLSQYERIKPYCKSVLRIVSCDFNLENPIGHAMAKVQADLFNNEATIDTVFRPSKKNPLVIDGVINVKNEMFNGKKQLASKFNKKTFMGKCRNCKEMCGVNVAVKNKFPNRRGVIKQSKLF
jgi:hypothetical protein